MPESLLPVDAPWGGLSEAFAFSDQPANTAREFQNSRLLDCRTGRARLSQRSGLSKYLTSALKVQGTKVADLLSFFEDNRQVTYSALSTETITWDAVTPSKKDCLNVRTDRQGNVYALDGNTSIVKLSADETQLWQVALPVTDPNHVVRALDVDEFDRVYVGVSAGGEQAKAKLICYEQLPDDKTELLWEVIPGGYIEDCLVFGDKLYTIQNHPDVMRSYVRIYDFIDEVEPELVQTWQVPHPANSIAVKKDGSVIVACEPSGDTTGLYWRNPDPRHPSFNVTSQQWTPKDLPNYDGRVWSWYVADDIDQSDLATDLADGVGVLRWRDRTKNNRHWYSEQAIGSTGPDIEESPVLAVDALNGHKGIRFNKPGATQPLQLLRTLPNSTVAKEFADQQRTAIPVYSESAFALYIVCRPSQTTDSGAIVPRWIFGQDRDNAASSSDDHILFANAADDSAASLPPANDPGSLYWFQGETITGGDGTPGGHILNGDFDVLRDGTTTNPGNFVIVSMIYDGGITGDAQVSLFQTNGCPIDSFTAISTDNASLEPSYLGVFKSFGNLQPSGSASGFLGDILEIICLDRRSRSDASLNIFTPTGSAPNGYDDLQADSPAQDQTINENTCIVGYLAHKYGAQANLPYGTAATDNYPHPFGITGTSPDQKSGPPNQAGTAVSDAQAKANKMFGCVVKYSPDGKIKWTANEMELVAGDRTGGFGYAVAVNSEGNIYSIGPEATGPGSDDNATIRLIIDQGDTFSLQVADGAWSDTTAAQFAGNTHPRIDVDEFDNVYFPAGTSGASFRVVDKTGAELHHYVGLTGAAAYAVAVDRRIPDYRSDITPKRAEHVIFVTGNGGDTEAETVNKIRLVEATQSGDSPRSLFSLGVSGGDIVKFTTAGVTSPTNGPGALDSGAYIQSTTLYKKAYWTDGRQYKRYSPQTNLITTYQATSAGSIPSRCALIETWRGRIVLARSADEPHNWFLSKKDEPNNWDFFPPVPGETDAVAGNNSPAGLCPDIINCVVPYSEDILVFGGDHSIWALIGDPAAGGRLELVSDTTGMAFGRPYCKDPAGVLYFFGSQGGLFRWTPAARPERVSLNKIERSLQDVDLSAYYIRLIYNHRDEGIHILQMPFGAGATHVTHWFFELKTESFSEDHFGTAAHTNVQPTAAMVLDGDEFDDRLVLFGCEDGYVRKWDRAAKSDDTRLDGSTKIAIDSFVTIGPLQGSAEEQTGGEFQFSGLTVVLSDQDDGARYEMYAAESPESIGMVVVHGDLKAGRNPPRWDRVCGAYCYLRLRNAAQEQRWSFERATMRVSPAGVARPRST